MTMARHIAESDLAQLLLLLDAEMQRVIQTDASSDGEEQAHTTSLAHLQALRERVTYAG